MRKITLQNFLKQSPEAPQYSDRNQHYLISGANPTYYLDNTGTQEEQIAPLISSLNWKQITASLDGNVIAMCPASYQGVTSTYSIFLMTETSQVFGVKLTAGVPTGIESLGYPSGSAVVNDTGKIVCVNNNNLYVTSYRSDTVFRLPQTRFRINTGIVTISIASPAVITLNNHNFSVNDIVVFSTTGALPTGITAGTPYYVISAGLTTNSFEISTSLGGGAVNTSGTQSGIQTVSLQWTAFGSGYQFYPTLLEPFLEYCMISKTSAIQKIDASYSILSGIDLGTGWNIVGMKNYYDKYLAIAGQLGSDFTQNYLFLWNGRTNTYSYSMKIPGKYIDMKVVDSTLYVAIQVTNGKTVLYYMSGTQLKEVFTPQYSSIDTVGQATFGVDVTPIFNFNNKVGIRLTSTSELVYPLLINGGVEVGKEEFILSSGNRFALSIVGSDGYLYSYEYTPSGVSNLYYYPLTNTAWQSILYKSQWIPVKNVSGIDIEYDTPPQSGTDAINVTIYGRGEDIISGTSTTVLDSITPTTYLNTTRTRLDVKGFVGDKIKIQLSSVNQGAWRCSIRKISIITE